MSKYVFARADEIVLVNAVEVQLVAGRAYAADDPAVKVYPHLFAASPVVYSSDGAVVEQATAAPGEKRATAAPAKRAAKRAR